MTGNASSRRAFLGTAAAGALVVAAAGYGTPAYAKGSTVTRNDLVVRLRRSIQKEKIEAKLAGRAPAWNHIDLWKKQIRVETLRQKVAVLEQTRQRWGADLTDSAARARMDRRLAHLQRRAQQLLTTL
jgi:hypothetical protein